MTARLRLSLACWEYPRTLPILNGEVQPEGIELVTIKSRPGTINWRAFNLNDLDVMEISLSSFIIATSRQQSKWLGIPVFPTRGFYHTGIICNADSGIKHPQDLKGKRVAMGEYQLTPGLWARAALQHEFSVNPADVSWFQERSQHRIPLNLPKGVSLTIIPPDKRMDAMLLEGELDAMLYRSRIGTVVDRSVAALQEDSRTRWLFPDKGKEMRRYFRKTHVFPFSNVIVINKALLERQPWIAFNLYSAFQTAKERSYQKMYEYDILSSPNLVLQSSALEEQARIFGKDPYHYGVASNRRELQSLLDYSMEQGLCDREVGIEELFAESVLKV